MRRKARVDDNQKEIVDYFRKLGASVLHLHTLKNCFDILVGYNGYNIIVEIKDGTKCKSQQKLTDGEEKFREDWKGGTYHIITSFDEVQNLLDNYLQLQ